MKKVNVTNSVTKSGVSVEKEAWFHNASMTECITLRFATATFCQVYCIMRGSVEVINCNEYSCCATHDQQIEIFAAVIEAIKEVRSK